MNSATVKVLYLLDIFEQLSSATARYQAVQESITPSWTGDGVGVLVGVGVEELLVGVGLRTTSMQYALPTLSPLQSFFTDGFYDILAWRERRLEKIQTHAVKSKCEIPQKSSK